jgi:hypothetical protein
MPRELPGFVDRAALRERLGAMPMPRDPQPGTDEHQVISWLTSLHLLYGVPFAYLVADIGMLPVESIRFFQVDNAWLEALIDGAFSIGAPRATSDSGTVLRAAAAPAARARLRRVRAALTGDTGTGTEAGGAPEAITGFLLRSAAVSGWPGLEVRGYADTAAQHPLPLLRLERVSPSLLFCLLGGVLQRVDLQEPPESLHFGVEPASSGPSPWQKQLRYASGDGSTPVGSPIPGRAQQVTLRPGTTNVLQVDALARAMGPDVWASPSHPSFTAAQFGLEMIEAAGWVSFQVGS